MRKLILLVIIILLAAGGVVFWQREKIRERFWPEKPLAPISQPSSIYDLVTLLDKSGLKAAEIPIIIDGTIQASVSGIKVFFATDKDLGLQVRSLQLVLPRLTMEGRKVSEIDLRFSKVVVRY